MDPVAQFIIFAGAAVILTILPIVFVYWIYYRIFKWLVRDTYDYVHRKEEYKPIVKKKFRNYFYWD